MERTRGRDCSRNSSCGPRPPSNLVHRLQGISQEVISAEQRLIEGLKTQKQAQSQIKEIQHLIQLRQNERTLRKERMSELENTLAELERRRTHVNGKITEQQRTIRRLLQALEASLREDSGTAYQPSREKLEAPRRKLLSNLTDRGIKEIEALRVDLNDSDQLEERIQDEKHQLASLFQDLQEQETLLEFNRRLQSDIFQRKHQERLADLLQYQNLKKSQGQVETLIQQFNARRELQRAQEAERSAPSSSTLMTQSAFGILKGKLELPILGGKIVGNFGRAFDPKSKLTIFRKGVEISNPKVIPVRAVASGVVAYSGELPDLGKVTVIDHGDHFYTLLAKLGEVSTKTGQTIDKGDAVGMTDSAGTPVYFEIRTRNVAVNPLQWLAN
ncbi:peptidoglycan DD-metalloendopeptidase family protein [Bdellovibrionota bacterium FG-2]